MTSKLTSLLKAIGLVMLTMLALTAFSQPKTISGKVTRSQDGVPIAGASITVKGTTVGTTSEMDGSFSLQVPANTKTIVVSSIGFDAQEIDITGKTMVSVALLGSTSSLSEIVVTGYTSQAKKDITGAVGIVKVEDMKSVPASNAESQLQGRAAGVTVTTSNAPGDGASVRIRGLASFSTDNSPLYVIDGVPTGGLGGLDPNDSERMQVLKDAAAASIYGSRASNGVIIITTKKGKQGGAKLSYDMFLGTQRPGDGFDLLSPQEYAEAFWLAYKNLGQTPPSSQYGTGASPVLPDYIQAGTSPSGGLFEGDAAADPSKYFLNRQNLLQSYLIVPANKNGTNWYDEITRNAPIQSHNLTVSGGADRSRYMFSFNYFDQDGIIIENFFKRYTARINTEFNIKKNIRIGENITILSSQSNGAGNNGEGTEIGMAYRNQTIIPVYDIAGNYAGSKGPNLGNATNPVATRLRAKDNRGNNFNLFGNMYAEVDFLKNFTARTSIGGTMNWGNYYYFTFQTYENAENNTGNQYVEGSSQYRQWIWTNTLNYKNTFNDIHDVNVLVGSEAIEDWGRSIEARRNSYFLEDPYYRSLNSGATSQVNSGAPYTPTSLFSLFGKVDYTLMDKYLFSATVRRDGSSRFGSNNRYAVFPAGSIGWRISEEEFMKGISWITDLKLRGSYGTMGNQRIDPLNAISRFGGQPSSSYYDLNGSSTSVVQGFQATFVGNPNGQWETNTTTNVGFDATLFGGKTDVSFDWYNKSTKDLLYQLPQPGTAGYAQGQAPAYVNVGSMKNTGIDLMITQRANLGGSNGVKMDATVTLTTYKNEITKIAEGVNYFEYDNGERGRVGGVFVRNRLGEPIASYYGYQVVGLFADQADVDKSPTQDGAAPGRFKYMDADGDGEITPDDRVTIGNPNPDFTYGLNLNFSYKFLDMSMFFYGAQGKDAINYVRWWTDFFPSFQGAKSKDLLYNSWTPDNKGARTPRIEDASNFSTNNAPNSYFVEDASYFRMKNLTIGFTVPADITRRVKIDRLRFYVQGSNLFTITNYTGLDPEIIGDDRGAGFDAGVYPTTRQLLIGLNLNF